MPLPKLVRIVEGTPAEIVALADELEYMSLRVELILVRGPLSTAIQRIYCADPEIPPHKIAFNHNSSDGLRRREVHSIMAEVSLSPDKAVDVNGIAPQTVHFLEQLGLIRGDDVVWTDHIDVKYAYPVYTHDRPRLVREIKNWLEGRNIFSVGRFGDWAYVNSDKCVHRGLELGRELRTRYPAFGPRGAGTLT
jgi:UDP-galactopyranose mutase